MVAGGSLRAMEAILRGDVEHAFHPGGGLHHAMRDRASGFCIYNDVALAVARARRDGLRVLYVDLDVHHGDGVQALFWDDPGVLTVSIHETGRYLFPGTGFADEIGDGAAAGTSVNVPLEPGTGEGPWLDAVRLLVPSLAAAFRPDIVVSQHGADSHAFDPLAHLRVTTDRDGGRGTDRRRGRASLGRWSLAGDGWRRLRRLPGGAPVVVARVARRSAPRGASGDPRGVAGTVGRRGGAIRAGATPRDIRRSPECRLPFRAGPGWCRAAFSRDGRPRGLRRRSRARANGGPARLVGSARSRGRCGFCVRPCRRADRSCSSRGVRARAGLVRGPRRSR